MPDTPQARAPQAGRPSAGAAPADPPPTGRLVAARLASIALWALRLGFAAILVIAAYRKFAGLPESVDLFDELGFGQWPRYAVAALELALAVGLLIPRLVGPAAIAAGLVMAGAVAAELYVSSGNWPLPLVLIGVAAILAFRWRQFGRPRRA